MDDQRQKALNELDSMKAIAEALSPLEEGAIRRVLKWAHDVFVGKGALPADESGKASADGVAPSSGDPERVVENGMRFDTLAEFFAAADPQQDTDRAMVAAYWLQVHESEGDFDSFSINKRLKDLGHGVGNITAAFNGLIARRPQLVIQTKKTGNSRQARKLYRLTTEGQKAVERMVQKT